MKQPDNPYINI